MNLKNKLFSIFIPIFSLLILTGCSDKEITLSKNTFEFVKEDEPVISSTAGTSSVFENEYYFLTSIESPSFKNGIPLLTKMNENGEIQILCDLENCNHNGVSCNAYITMDTSVYVKHNETDYLFGLDSSNHGMFLGYTVQTFDEVNPKEAEILLNFEEHSLNADSAIFYNNYMVSQASSFYNYDIGYLTKTNLETGEFEHVFEYSKEYGTQLKVIGIYEENVIFYISDKPELFREYTTALDGQELMSFDIAIYSYNIKTDRVSLLQKYTSGGWYIIELDNNYIYTIQDTHLLYRLNLNTLTSELILDSSSTGKSLAGISSYDIKHSVVDNHLFYSLLGNTNNYHLDLNTLNSNELLLNYVDYYNYTRPVDILAVFENGYYLVGLDYIDTVNREFALIKNEDYWSNNPNYISLGAHRIF